ncbi:MAG: SDR family NAD(P)-dependent oxidoreductase [Spirochaeta sp.]
MKHERTAMVTGAANGIGRAIAAALADAGMQVLAVDKDAGAGAELADSRPGIAFLEADLSDEAQLLEAAEWVRREWTSWDILVNNAGISRFVPLTECSSELWDEILAVNLRAPFLLSREFARQFRERSGEGCGRIINIGSTRAVMSEPGGEAYGAGKGGIRSLTHALANSLSGTGITVNCIAPGWIHTGSPGDLSHQDHSQHPSGRVGTPADIARLVLFLCEPDNDFITGEELRIDGGMTRKMIYAE